MVCRQQVQDGQRPIIRLAQTDLLCLKNLPVPVVLKEHGDIILSVVYL